MHLSNKPGKAIAESHWMFTSKARYIRFIIDLYAASEVKREFWLTEREKDFFVGTVLHVISGERNPISDTAIRIYKEMFNFRVSKREISDYINKISKRKWLIYDKDQKRVEIPEILSRIEVEDDMVDFKIRVSYEADRQDLERDH